MPLSLYLLNMKGLDEIALQKLVATLPEALQNKAASYRFPADRRRVLLSDLFIRKMLAQELSIACNFIKIDRSSFGKPFLKNHTRQFNLSHAGDFIVLATDETPVGIDIEYVRPLNDLEGLLENFSEEEQQTFLGMNEEEQLDRFYDLWTLKESYVKAIGAGLSCPLQSFTVNLFGAEPLLSKPADTPMTWYFKRYALADGYKCSVCAQHREFPPSFTTVPINELLL